MQSKLAKQYNTMSTQLRWLILDFCFDVEHEFMLRPLGYEGALRFPFSVRWDLAYLQQRKFTTAQLHAAVRDDDLEVLKFVEHNVYVPPVLLLCAFFTWHDAPSAMPALWKHVQPRFEGKGQSWCCVRRAYVLFLPALVHWHLPLCETCELRTSGAWRRPVHPGSCAARLVRQCRHLWCTNPNKVLFALLGVVCYAAVDLMLKVAPAGSRS